ncbi:MAG: fumarylacetoacetate hydrolase family protein [Bacilli bacterium]
MIFAQTTIGPLVNKQDTWYDLNQILLENGYEKRKTTLEQYIQKEGIELENLLERMKWSEKSKITEPFTFLAPIVNPPKNILCIGKNYREHAVEMGATSKEIGKFIVFTKAKEALIGPNESISLHADVTSELDYEGEILVILGKDVYKLKTEEEAHQAIFGYTLFNDVTARDLQTEHVQFFIGKSLPDTSGIGPVILSHSTGQLTENSVLETYVNDELRQSCTIGQMMYPVAKIIYMLSQTTKLKKGDCIATGTPSGVGKGMKPPQYLRAGDVVSIHVEAIGTLENTVK